MPAVIVPLPFIARVQNGACNGMAAQLKTLSRKSRNGRVIQPSLCRANFEHLAGHVVRLDRIPLLQFDVEPLAAQLAQFVERRPARIGDDDPFDAAFDAPAESS